MLPDFMGIKAVTSRSPVGCASTNQQAYNVKTTSIQRWFNVKKMNQRWIDVVSTMCVCWAAAKAGSVVDSLLWFLLPTSLSGSKSNLNSTMWQGVFRVNMSLKTVYRNIPKQWDKHVWANSVDQIRCHKMWHLIRVYTVWHSFSNILDALIGSGKNLFKL